MSRNLKFLIFLFISLTLTLGCVISTESKKEKSLSIHQIGLKIDVLNYKPVIVIPTNEMGINLKLKVRSEGVEPSKVIICIAGTPYGFTGKRCVEKIILPKYDYFFTIPQDGQIILRRPVSKTEADIRLKACYNFTTLVNFELCIGKDCTSYVKYNYNKTKVFPIDVTSISLGAISEEGNYDIYYITVSLKKNVKGFLIKDLEKCAREMYYPKEGKVRVEVLTRTKKIITHCEDVSLLTEGETSCIIKVPKEYEDVHFWIPMQIKLSYNLLEILKVPVTIVPLKSE